VSRHLSSAEPRPTPSAQEPFDRSALDRLFRECAVDVHGYAIAWRASRRRLRERALS